MRLQGAPRGAVGKETSTDTQLKKKGRITEGYSH
jgi:hypothetical protein